MKKIITRVLTISASICVMLSLMLCHVHAAKANLQYYNTDFKTSNTAARKIVAAAKAQISKTSQSLRYNVDWNSHFVADCARLVDIPEEIIPYKDTPNDLFNALLKDHNAKEVSRESVQAGDIVFFSNYNGKMVSCGIMAGKNEVIKGNVTNPDIKNSIGGVWATEHSDLSRKYSNNINYARFVRPNYLIMNQKFTVTFKADGASNIPKKISKKYGESPKIPDTVPVKENLYFLGWATTEGGEIKYLPGASYRENNNATLYAVWSDTNDTRLSAPSGGGNTVFTPEEIMYPGDPGTAFHNAIAKSDVWSPAIGGYETFFGVKTERAEYLGLDCVKVSLLEGFTQGYFDFNYYQYDCGYYRPSLEGSKAKWLKIKYSYNVVANSVRNLKVFASKDVYPQTEKLQTASSITRIKNNHAQWNEAVIYLGDVNFTDKTIWTENTIRQFRIHMFEGNKNENAECYIAGFGFFETEEEALAFDFNAKPEKGTQAYVPAQYNKPTPGGKVLFSVEDMMYEGDPGTQFHNAFAKPDVINPNTGKYETFFGVDMEKTTYLGRKCIKVSLLDNYTQGFLDFNYYQWDADYYNPSLDARKYNYLVVNYSYQNSSYAPKYMQFYASKDVTPLRTNNLQTATKNEALNFKSGEWNQVIFDLSNIKFTDGTKWNNNTVRQWRIYPFVGNDNPNARIYISSIGFFETEEAAKSWDGSVE